MSSICFNHMDRAAVGTCVQCGSPVCGECHEEVAGKSVCVGCVDKIRERLESQMASSVPASEPVRAGGAFGAPPPQAIPQGPPQVFNPNAPPQVYNPAQQQVPYYAVQSQAIPAWRLPVGVLAGIAVGLLGGVIWDKFVYYTHINIGFLTIAIGYAVAYVLVGVSQRGGMVPAIITAVITFFAQLYGHVLRIVDIVALQSPGMHISVIEAIPLLSQEIQLMDWVIIAIGTYAGFKMAMRSQR